MRQQDASIKQFFACPSGCGRYLIDQDPQYQVVPRGTTEAEGFERVARLGKCKCGARVCVRCHAAAELKAEHATVVLAEKGHSIVQSVGGNQPEAEREPEAEGLAIGDRVSGLYPNGHRYNATIVEVHGGGGEYTLTWDDGDQKHRRQPAKNLRAIKPPRLDGLEPTAAERQEIGRKLAVSRTTLHLIAFPCGSAS